MRSTRGLSTRLVVAIGVLAALHVAVFAVLLVTLDGLRHADQQARASSLVIAAAHDMRLALARGDAVTVNTAADLLRRTAREADAAAAVALADDAAAASSGLDAIRGAPALDARLAAVIDGERAARDAERADADRLARYAWIAGVTGALAMLACVGGLLVYMRRALLAPLLRVVDVSRRLAAGDLEARVGRDTAVGEVGELARSFDQMADSLEGSRAALEHKNRELEQQRAELIEAVRSAREGTSIVRAVLDATPDAIALLDGAGAVIVDNPPMRAVRAAFAAHGAGLDGHEAHDGLRQGASGRAAELRDEVELPGTRRIFARFAGPVHDGRGRLIGRLLVLREISREREAERAKEDFFALVSHELRTPLTAILGYVDLVVSDDRALPAEQARHLEVVERNARRLVRLVGDLLFAAQVEGAPLLLEPGPVDLVQLTRDAVDLARPRAQEGGVALELELTPLAPSLGDRDRLAQVLDNLVSNALKFTLPGGRVTVGLTAVGSRARIEVSDTGVGIPDEDLPHLFDRFYRARNAREGAVPGLGLGLMIVRAIVEAHGGTVTVRSTLGGGTTFTLLLPLREPGGQAAPTREQPQSDALGMAPGASGVAAGELPGAAGAAGAPPGGRYR